MLCCRHDHYAQSLLVEEHERIFEVDASRVVYGQGALAEIGTKAQELGLRRAALFTDKHIASLPFMATVRSALKLEKIDTVEFDNVAIEPTDASFREAAAFASDGKFDGYISVGGGSVIDTAKAANLLATYPADLLEYVNAPIGAAKPVPGPLRPHIAAPTTCGTGAECTGIAIFDYVAMKAKTGIASRRLRPTIGIVDPDTTLTLPNAVVACSGFDVLSHALESLTARPYTQRRRPSAGAPRPMSQGANPFSDGPCLQALELTGAYIVRAATDASDREAREHMMFAATLAGIGFGNAGVHVPHGMAYSVAGLVHEYRPPGYPQHDPIVPHGMSVIINAPAAVEYTAQACPERHLLAATRLGADPSGASIDDAGALLRNRLISLMKATQMPNGLRGLGYTENDLEPLVEGAFPQQRLLQNAPREITKQTLRDLYVRALTYW